MNLYIFFFIRIRKYNLASLLFISVINCPIENCLLSIALLEKSKQEKLTAVCLHSPLGYLLGRTYLCHTNRVYYSLLWTEDKRNKILGVILFMFLIIFFSVVRLIEQYLKENNLLRTLSVLQVINLYYTN